MRINKFVAQATGMSRRAADAVIAEQRIQVNNQLPGAGQQVNPGDRITLDGKPLVVKAETVTIMLNKPVGYVCSRNGQGSKTIYELLPEELHLLKPVGRLDKDSSGLLLLTNNGQLAYELTHPSFQKEKVYEIELDKPLSEKDKAKIEQGVMLEDGVSKLRLRRMEKEEWRRKKLRPSLTSHSSLLTPAYEVRLREGRNRQIRRTFEALGYSLPKLHRTQFGGYTLTNLQPAQHQQANPEIAKP